MRIAETTPVSASEANALFSDLSNLPAVVIAVSGGPDSTALMMLMARWRAARKSGPNLFVATVDHGLRPEARHEAAAVGRLARKLGLPHRILHWAGKKPATGLQEAAREARYRLLAGAARATGARHVLTAHTRDDQAETVLIRLCRGSGLSGLAAMGRRAAMPGAPDLELVRPLLDIPKTRLLATLKAAKIPFVTDPSNRDPRFTRSRMRALMPALADEGLDSARLALFARRVKRAEAALEAATDQAAHALLVEMPGGAVALEAVRLADLPAEIALRLLGRLVARIGHEGPVELGKLEALQSALAGAIATKGRLRRSLAGAVVTLAGANVLIEQAPPRRSRNLTTGGGGAAGRAKTR